MPRAAELAVANEPNVFLDALRPSHLLLGAELVEERVCGGVGGGSDAGGGLADLDFVEVSTFGFSVSFPPADESSAFLSGTGATGAGV